MNKSLKQRGYTLIELLAVMVIMGTVGFIITAILVSSLRGSSKATVVNEIRQNGNYAILQMGRMIGFSQAFLGASTDHVTPYTTNCTPSPSPDFKYLKIKLFDDKETILSCNLNANPPTGWPYGWTYPAIASNGASFINANEVSVETCGFTCTQNSISEPPVIGIKFRLTQKSSSALFEKRSTIPFETSVTTRNLNE